MKLGIVGLPNVGKSTLFNSLTKAGAESANYPFCTIDPNIGIVAVPDQRLKVLSDMYASAKIVPAFLLNLHHFINRAHKALICCHESFHINNSPLAFLCSFNSCCF